MWEPRGAIIDLGRLGALEPREILYEYDGEPLTFVARDPDGASLLVHNLAASDHTTRYLASTVDTRILTDLRAGRIDLLSGLRQPRCWIVDLAEDAAVKSAWMVDFDSIPKEVLPRSGAMLNPNLDPLFRLRLIGPGVGPGRTSAGDVRMAAQAAESGLRGLARIALVAKRQVGQVPRDIRHYSDLPYLFSRAASFELAFGRPRDGLPGLDEEVFAEMGRLLERGLTALRADGEEDAPVEGLETEQILQLFEAIKALTPPTKGAIDQVEIGGQLIDEKVTARILTRDDRIRSMRRIKSSRRTPRKEAPFRVSGIIEEADQGTFSFTLREIDAPEPNILEGMHEIRFQFEEHLYDKVMEAFNTLELMVVVGERMDSRYQALDVRPAVDEPEDLAMIQSANRDLRE